ncbi:MAG: hypothetical protein ACTSXP_10710 [Promethearchaeota archaeon]
MHSIFGGVIGLFLYFLTKNSKKRFNERMVILFALNSFIGPDLFKIPSMFIFPSNLALRSLNLFLHSIIGWLLWSFIISVPYWIAFQYKARYPDALLYFNVVKINIAAGMMHLGFDVLDLSRSAIYGNLRIVSWDESTAFNLDSFHSGWNYPTGVFTISSIRLGAGILFLIGLSFLMVLTWLLLKKKVGRATILAGMFVVLVFIMILLFGSRIVGYEHDLGYFVYASTFFLGPVVLLFWSFQDVNAEMKVKCIYECQLIRQIKNPSKKKK